MARRVFFSFHYERDIRRVVQIRKSWVVRGEKDTQPFFDKADWESLKRSSPNAVENWIEKQLKGTSVTVVLIGKETFNRRWVKHEIKRSHDLKKGILGIYIHGVKDPQLGTDAKGKNPLDHWQVNRNGIKWAFSQLYPTYDWVADDGYKNISKWIESAAKDANR